MKKVTFFISFPILLFLSLTGLSQAFALTACLPVPANGVIIKEGCYYLNNNLHVTSNKPGILISASHVTLDLNNKKIFSKNENKKIITYGILVSNASNIKIYNGQIENIYYGIAMVNVKNSNVSNIKFIKINNIGITLSHCEKINITHNKFTLNTLYEKTDNKEFYLVGINSIETKNLLIKNNEINYKNPLKITDNPKLEQVGILLSSNNKNVYIEENIIALNTLRPKTIGIWCADTNRTVIIKNNRFINQWHSMILKCKDVRVLRRSSQRSSNVIIKSKHSI